MLYRFQIELSDIDRGVYETLDFRIVQHPSETLIYMLTRLFAYILNYEPNLIFSAAGLSDPDSPAMQIADGNGAINLWIEIGNPSTKKLHKAMKSAKNVTVFTYKSAQVLVDDIKSNDVHRAAEIKIVAVDAKFLQQLETHVAKNNRWSILHQHDQLDINTGASSLSSILRRITVKEFLL